MYSFLNDYSEGAHPLVLKRLVDSNLEQTIGYSEDKYCQQARELICQKIDQNADVHFFVGGTQVNLVFLSFILKDFQAVIACDEGHICVHETGAIESTGHKVLSVPHVHGKVTVEALQQVLELHESEHMVQPKAVYLSQTTELGTYYTRSELERIYHFTQENDLFLYIDGARLGSALVLEDAPSLKDIASCCDAFTIGGTKMGAMFGEALLIVNEKIKDQFRFQMKQKGALLAKGRLLGLQFLSLLEDDLYFEIGKHENEMAKIIRESLKEAGYALYEESQTNQIFVDIPNDHLDKLEIKYNMSHIKTIDSNTTRVRLVTSWATTKEAVQAFAKEVISL